MFEFELKAEIFLLVGLLIASFIVTPTNGWDILDGTVYRTRSPIDGNLLISIDAALLLLLFELLLLSLSSASSFSFSALEPASFKACSDNCF